VTFTEFPNPGAQLVTDHQRLRNRGTDDAHPQYSLATHTHGTLPLGKLGYAEITGNQGSITTEVALTGLTKTVTVGSGRSVRITASVNVAPSDTTTGAKLRIKEGTTTLRQLGMPRQDAAVVDTIEGSIVVDPSAGDHTYHLTLEADRSGGGSLTAYGNPGPSFILVEDIGAA
jgi:hypothetical protein